MYTNVIPVIKVEQMLLSSEKDATRISLFQGHSGREQKLSALDLEYGLP